MDCPVQEPVSRTKKRHIAGREQCLVITSLQGRNVRAMHAAKSLMALNDGKVVQKTLWDHLETMSADHAHTSFQQRWDQIAGASVSLKNDQDSFNENNPNAAGKEVYLEFNFEPFVEQETADQKTHMVPMPDGSRLRRDHRAFAAFLAASDRSFGVIAAARAAPPFFPPSRPSSTAAGSFGGRGGFLRPRCRLPRGDFGDSGRELVDVESRGLSAGFLLHAGIIAGSRGGRKMHVRSRMGFSSAVRPATMLACGVFCSDRSDRRTSSFGNSP